MGYDTPRRGDRRSMLMRHCGGVEPDERDFTEHWPMVATIEAVATSSEEFNKFLEDATGTDTASEGCKRDVLEQHLSDAGVTLDKVKKHIELALCPIPGRVDIDKLDKTHLRLLLAELCEDTPWHRSQNT